MPVALVAQLHRLAHEQKAGAEHPRLLVGVARARRRPCRARSRGSCGSASSSRPGRRSTRAPRPASAAPPTTRTPPPPAQPAPRRRRSGRTLAGRRVACSLRRRSPARGFDGSTSTRPSCVRTTGASAALDPRSGGNRRPSMDSLAWKRCGTSCVSAGFSAGASEVTSASPPRRSPSAPSRRSGSTFVQVVGDGPMKLLVARTRRLHHMVRSMLPSAMARSTAAAVGGSPQAPQSISSPRRAFGCSARYAREQVGASQVRHPLIGEHERDLFAAVAQRLGLGQSLARGAAVVHAIVAPRTATQRERDRTEERRDRRRSRAETGIEVLLGSFRLHQRAHALRRNSTNRARVHRKATPRRRRCRGARPAASIGVHDHHAAGSRMESCSCTLPRT